ncbi:MAG: GNVR domain-containing protein [bacterium]
MATQELHFYDYWRIIHRRRYILLFFFITITTAALIFSLMKIPTYTTFSRIRIITDNQNNMEGLTMRMDYSDPWTVVNTEANAIMSLDIAEEVAQKMALINAKDSFQERMNIAGRLLAHIEAKREGETNIIRIISSGATPQESADIANGFAQVFITHKIEQKLEAIRETRRFLEARLVEADRKLKESEDALKIFKEKFTEQGTSASIAAKINDLKITRNNLLKNYTSQHPDIIKISSQISFLEKRAKELPSQEQYLAELNRKVKLDESDYITLSEKFKKAQITEANTTQNIFMVSKAPIPSKPSSPNHPVNTIAGGILGIIIGLIFVFVFENLDTSIGTIEEVEQYMGLPVLGVIPHIDLPHDEKISFWKRFKTRFFRNKNKKLPADRRTLIIFHSKKSHFAESYHTLRTNIKFSALGSQGKTLLFTSAGTDEGKTITAANFCIAAAMVGIKTLLVEADLRRPVISQLFGLPRREGLTDLVLGNARWPDPVYGISDFLLGELGVEHLLNNPAIENLKILPAGSIHTNPVDILSSPEFDNVLSTVSVEFDLIVFDCSPVLLFADSIILGKKVEAVALIYQVGKMARGALKRAKAQLEGLQASVKGVVLNDLRAADMGPQYGYYYYSSYKYYTTDLDKKIKQKA